MVLPKIATNIIEAFQGVLATSDIAQKCGDNLFLIHRQPTKTDRKRATICDRDNPFLVSTKRHVFALLFLTATSLPGSMINHYKVTKPFNYLNYQQYVKLSTKTLPRIVFLYDCKFKYETEERYES